MLQTQVCKYLLETLLSVPLGMNPGVACQGEALGSVRSEARVTAPEICAGEKLEGCSLTVSQEGHDEGTSESFHAPVQNLRPHRCGHLPDLNYVFEMDPGAELSLQKPPNPESAQKRDSTWLQTPPAGGGRHPGAESGTGACAQTPLGFFGHGPGPRLIGRATQQPLPYNVRTEPAAVALVQMKGEGRNALCSQ